MAKKNIDLVLTITLLCNMFTQKNYNPERVIFYLSLTLTFLTKLSISV